MTPPYDDLVAASVMPVVVSYRTRYWIRVGVGSFRKQFPDWPLLVVDNNPSPGEPEYTGESEEEREWLHAQQGLIILPNEVLPRTHGGGLDLALDWCRRNARTTMLHFEPDCLIFGETWVNALLAALESGAWMAGLFRSSYGPIHPTPSAWRVDQVAGSFQAQPRGAEELHPRFSELFSLEALQRVVEADGDTWEWWRHHWDTAQRNWFHAAIHDRATLVSAEAETGFRHYWCGSTHNRESKVLWTDPALREFISGSAGGAELAQSDGEAGANAPI